MERTAQEIFDIVVNHLRTQHAKSVVLNPDGSTKMVGDRAVCLYRSEDGKMKCAAGVVITDEEYKPGMEGNNIRTVIEKFVLKELAPHAALLDDLQRAHDFYGVEDWEGNFRSIARTFNLTYTPPTP